MSGLIVAYISGAHCFKPFPLLFFLVFFVLFYSNDVTTLTIASRCSVRNRPLFTDQRPRMP